MLSKDDETIVAQCTPSGKGAIALIRLCGLSVREIVGKMARLASGKSIADVVSGTVHYGKIVDEMETIDHVMLIIIDGPKTFTGQNTIEITCHNNPFLIERIITLAILHGARHAQEGEFSKRAFLHGKINLLEAEAIHELIGANTQMALKKALAQLEGSFSHHMAQIEQELVRILAWCEASFEFLDEEQEFGQQINTNLLQIINQIDHLKKAFDAQQQIRQGIKIALIGSVNAGKSSLFNALIGHDRSIVTDIAGTTRDVIEAGIYRNGNYWTLIDTAGLRHTDNIIEQEGIKRSRDEAHKADIILLVFDGSRALSTQEEQIYHEIRAAHADKVLLVKNKCDLPNKLCFENPNTFIEASCHVPQSIIMLEKAIEEKIAYIFARIQSPYLLNKRQCSILMGLENKLITILSMLQGIINYELVSHHLKDALQDMTELTGKSVSEEGLDRVFKEFCVGK